MDQEQARSAGYEVRQGPGRCPQIKERTHVIRPDIQEVQMLALQQHDAIADDFGKDKGMELMRLDSAIALDVMYHFAEQGIPVLGVHDSLIVARQHRDELDWAMDFFYRKKVGDFEPVIKESENTRRLMAA